MSARAARSARLLLLSAIVSAFVGCDQLTKQLAIDRLSDAPAVSLLQDTVRLQYAENPGAFLGLGTRLPHSMRAFLLTGINLLLLVGVFAYLLTKWNIATAQFVALALVLAGGLGNLADRLLREGFVVDFLNVGVGPLRTGIFNVADVAISTGVCLLLFSMRRNRTQQQPRPAVAVDVPGDCA